MMIMAIITNKALIIHQAVAPKKVSQPEGNRNNNTKMATISNSVLGFLLMGCRLYCSP